MQKISMRWLLAIATLHVMGMLAGCNRNAAEPAPEAPAQAATEAPPPEVTVVTLKHAPATLMRELPGRTRAATVAEVRPQVSGLVKRRLFVEGQFVKAGEALYELDAAAYRNDLAGAKASLLKAQATRRATELAASRSRRLIQTHLISAQDHDSAIAAEAQARADVGIAQAALDGARLQLERSRITAPISGHIGKSSVTEGALVTANQTEPMATITQLDPLYIEVNQPSSQWLSLKQAIDAGRLHGNAAGAPVKVLLEDGSAYAHPGTLQFSEVTVDPGTGSFLLRVVVPNPDSLLLPGMYVRAVVSEGVLPSALLAPVAGIARDPKGSASALVVAADGKVQAREVKVSRIIDDRWLVEEGLQAGDRLIVEGVQKAAPDMTVKPVERADPAVPAPL